jgi:hypothetical protein
MVEPIKGVLLGDGEQAICIGVDLIEVPECEAVLYRT